MESCYELEKQSPRKAANIFSKLLFLWMAKICYKGSTKKLELKDIFKSQDKDQSAILTDRLQRLWNQEKLKGASKSNTPSLTKALARAYYCDFLINGLFMMVNIIGLRSIQPLILAGLVRCFTSGDYTLDDILFYGGGLILSTLLALFLTHHTTSHVNLVGMRIRIALSALIYRKVLKLSQLSLSQTASGKVVNLLANDLARFDIVTMFLNYLWIGPIQVILVTYLMYMEIGTSSFSGVITMLLLTLPLQLFLGKVTSKYRQEVAVKTDLRVRIMNEILSGISVIKMYAWERPFEQVVASIRHDEVKSLTKTSYVRAILVSFTSLVERATLAVTVITYVFLGNQIRADLIFALAMFFNMLQFTLAIVFPFAISMGAETLVSIKRIQDFLLMEEKDDSKMNPSPDKNVRLKHVDASWVLGTPTLRNLNLVIPHGSFCAVVGPVGCGKSSILQLLLGELINSSGSIELSGDISYASQEAWLFTSSVRQNILFGQEYNRSLYNKVVKVCALERDFEQFSDNDQTMVGDRGVSLSGGQRARINLARAVYRDADIYLLDDPLSAVDTKVGRHLFDECILTYLKGKTRILVTHQLQYLKKADFIIVLNKGTIEAQGTFDELSQSDLDFTKMLIAADESNENPCERQLSRAMSIKSTGTVTTHETEDKENVMKKENIEVVTFEGSAFWSYLKFCGSLPLKTFVFLLMVTSQILLSGSDFWITFWTAQDEMKMLSQTNITADTYNVPTPEFEVPRLEYIFTHTAEYLKFLWENVMNQYTDVVTIQGEKHILLKNSALASIYAFLVSLAVIFTLAKAFLYFYCCMKGSKNLHNSMFHCLLESPMRFFDTNTSGRVLNRFSKDMGAIDELLPRAMMDALAIVFVMTGILVLVIVPNPYISIIVIILGFVFFKVREWYTRTAKAVKHLESMAKSPVFSYVNSTMDGLTTIRATKNEKILMKQFDEHQDVHTSAWYLTVLCTVAFGLWLDLICVIFVACVIGSFVVLEKYTFVNGSFVGLAISQSLVLVGMLQFGMRQISQVVNYLTSVERVLEYTQLEREEPLTTPRGNEPTEPWPNNGNIIFKNLSLKYVPTDRPVLNDLNIDISSAEKIGIVGRTGAGKSSLIAALFRLAPIEGTITIDGIDTQKLGLRELRKKISIIPQEPVLFSATMRYNLDPFNEFKDDNLWDALEEVEMKNEVNSLDLMVTEGGSNFSVGQRQLVCLARALLRKNRILILDEATANVDPRTDELIQKTIRKKFQDCTVLTIAHRLNTIMDSDKVLVMDSGCMIEFDHPYILLQNIEGYFTRMLLETGPTMTQILSNIARESYEAKFRN